MQRYEVGLFSLVLLALISLFTLSSNPILAHALLFLAVMILLVWMLIVQWYDKKYGPKFYPIDQLAGLLESIKEDIQRRYPLRIKEQPHNIVSNMGECTLELICYAESKWTGEKMHGNTPSHILFGTAGFTREGGMLQTGVEALEVLATLVDRGETAAEAYMTGVTYTTLSNNEGRRCVQINCSTVEDSTVTYVTKIERTYHVFLCEVGPNQETKVQIPALEQYFC